HEVYNTVEQPVYINQNAYYNGADPFEREEVNLVDNQFNPNVEIIEKEKEVYLSIELPENFENFLGDVHETDTLERTRLSDAEFENPDGSDVILDTDLLGTQKEGKS